MKILTASVLLLALSALSGCIIHDHGRGGWHDRGGYGNRYHHYDRGDDWRGRGGYHRGYRRSHWYRD